MTRNTHRPEMHRGSDDGTFNADDVPITDTGGFFTSTHVEGALQELGDDQAFGDVTTTAVLKSGVDTIESTDQTSWLSLLNDETGGAELASTSYVGLAANSYTAGGADGDKHFLWGGHGLVLPKLTADPASSASETGQLYYNTSTNKFRAYDGTNWVDLN